MREVDLVMEHLKSKGFMVALLNDLHRINPLHPMSQGSFSPSPFNYLVCFNLRVLLIVL
jgi:hypothetical protein